MSNVLANSVGQYEMAHNKPSHLDLHCLPLSSVSHRVALIISNGK